MRSDAAERVAREGHEVAGREEAVQLESRWRAVREPLEGCEGAVRLFLFASAGGGQTDRRSVGGVGGAPVWCLVSGGGGAVREGEGAVVLQ